MGTAIDKVRSQLAKRAESYASEELSGSSFITLQGGILKFGEDEFPGNEMLVIILDAVHENTYYDVVFDIDNPAPPRCFAFGRSEKDMEPHENVPDPDDGKDSYFELQAVACSECPHNEWGSAERGTGKACSQRRRLAIIPAGRFVEGKKRRETEMEVFDDPDHFRSADIAFLKLPVTSTKNWGRFVHMLNRDHQLPPFAVLTHVWIENDAKTQFKVNFDIIETISDPDILEILMGRNDEASKLIEHPYGEPSDDLPPPNKQKSGIAKLRKKK